MVEIAGERMELLMREAERAALSGRLERADRYVELARLVGMRYNLRVPVVHRRRICTSCYRYLLPGVTSRTRLKRGRSVTTCMRCGHVTRIPLAPRKRRVDRRDGGVGGGR